MTERRALDGHSALDEVPVSELLQLLMDERDITRVVLRYAHGIDRGDIDMVAACYHPGAYDDHGYASGTVEEFTARLRKHPAGQGVRQHLIGNVLIEVRAGAAVSEAYFLCYMEDLDGSGSVAPIGLFGGRYVDRLEKRDGDWRILRRICVIDWSRELGAAPSAPKADTFRRGSSDDLDPAVLALRELAALRR
ncbi:nuclear transport factor 2 family protein [Spongiactinospora sp. TRM90649]|uniref:nuclear transport factor 2 family protein n=1 Tax=Spongiactinospora sp. TRM90649 TaxID=3031114 RepID=UPI0023F9BDD1|nr:nuclear transport factor 2 family protein [Spongiactinospora sp. TRM90649]MDF5753438.1 nuclear transport factor 2 family protein [Spongiactinospora sp. TRM90649]